MTRAISRDSFDELKNYLGVYLQQGRVILDADWNESQDIALSLLRRLVRESVGEGSPNDGFRIASPYPTPPPPPFSKLLEPASGDPDEVARETQAQTTFGPLPFFAQFPGHVLDAFDSADGWSLAPPQLRVSRDRPYEGASFLRLSGHPSTPELTELKKTLPDARDFSTFELATFRYRLNEPIPGDFRFFLEDVNGNRSVWANTQLKTMPKNVWLPAFVTPLDIRFHILNNELPRAARDEPYTGIIKAFGATSPITWSVTGDLPPGILGPNPINGDSLGAELRGTPTRTGVFAFTIAATAGGTTRTRALAISVLPVRGPLTPIERLPTSPPLARPVTSTGPSGVPADLARIRAYGFEVYQSVERSLVWDFDFLNLGSRALKVERTANDFIICGSALERRNARASLTRLLSPTDPSRPVLNVDFDSAEPSIQNAGCMYVGGLPCIQMHDVLYSEQADPNDTRLTTPEGSPRTDAVYLDVWQEAVTYVEDPAIRDIALGGPDTATRLRVKQRVRVAQGGEVPTDDGRGFGTLSTEGSYSGTSNRLYLVEVDQDGNIGKATFRWSEDNASSIQRVIDDVPLGSTNVKIEDASGYRKGDIILIRKEFGEEEHKIASVFGNVLTLEEPTGAQLEKMLASKADPSFTTFSFRKDRPKVQRWNALRVPIVPDAGDSTLSGPISLSDGVQVRFGGFGLRKGDYWNFKTRYLGGDPASGFDNVKRIEELSFARARGVVHDYAPLALIVRDPASAHPERITLVKDRRRRIGAPRSTVLSIPEVQAKFDSESYAGGAFIYPSPDSEVLVLFTGRVSRVSGGDNRRTYANLSIRLTFYDDTMTNPVTAPEIGRVLECFTLLDTETELGESHSFTVLLPPLPQVPPRPFRATSVHLFLKMGRNVQLAVLGQLSITEIKRG